ncbi:hypothetical protein ACFOQM_05910 [Paenibacillus sp. GCM10012307]|uniref:Uncharacterized protein n=1 Tax=Paenibacillus roseus TaxID=2798579 RepID=A0A934MPF7_9BACL|nr:hypothetical protein [Paenibacillus roseus]MBJ6360833.1 hypothetical protein [Paenibacillus roseus]
MIEPLYDEYGVPLCRSGVGERIWAFYHSDPERFKAESRAYFALGMPGWTVVKANYQHRIIWLRDDRRRTV